MRRARRASPAWRVRRVGLVDASLEDGGREEEVGGEAEMELTARTGPANRSAQGGGV